LRYKYDTSLLRAYSVTVNCRYRPVSRARELSCGPLNRTARSVLYCTVSYLTLPGSGGPFLCFALPLVYTYSIVQYSTRGSRPSLRAPGWNTSPDSGRSRNPAVLYCAYQPFPIPSTSPSSKPFHHLTALYVHYCMYACAKVLYYAQKQPVNKGWGGAGERERERDKDLEKDEREKRRKKGKKGLLYFTKPTL